jgi:hypothetical protein
LLAMTIASDCSFGGSVQVKWGCAVATVAPGGGVTGVAAASVAAAKIAAPASKAMKIVLRCAVTD